MGGSALSLDVQRFLKGFKDIELGIKMLTQKFAINVSCDMLEFGDGSKERVWVLNYDQIKSKGGSKLENECRGLILNDHCEIVSMSFSRFFNEGSPYAAKLDWESTNAEFKHDGTLVVVYSYKGNYFIQTRGRANADGPLPGDPSKTYYDAVFEILKGWAEQNELKGDPFQMFREHNTNDQYTWAFEFVSPDNRVITPYTTEDLILTGAFNKNIPAEVKAHYVDQFATMYGISRPSFTRITCMEAAHSLLDRMNVLEEGVVVTDHFCRRVKVKKSSYRAVARIEQTRPEDLTARQFAAVVLNGESGYVADYYPEYLQILDFLNEVVEVLMEEVQTMWMLYRLAPDRRTFAEHVQGHPMSHILFLAWDDKIEDMTDALKYIKPEHLVQLATEYHSTSFNAAFEATVKAKIKRNAQGSEEEAKTKNASTEA